MSQASVLIVDDNEDLCQTLAEVLRKGSNKVRTSYTGEHALSILRKDIIDLVLLDIKLPDVNGIKVLETIKELDPEILVIMITALTDAKPAVDALKSGAYDYLMKPFELDELKLVVAKALETQHLKREVSRLKTQQKDQFPDNELFGNTKPMQELKKLIKIVAATPKTSVLIQGESGTGKELVANATHNWSARAVEIRNQSGRSIRIDASWHEFDTTKLVTCVRSPRPLVQLDCCLRPQRRPPQPRNREPKRSDRTPL